MGSRFIAVDILHLVAYGYSLYISRFVEPEQPVALMEEVSSLECLYMNVSGRFY